MNYHSWSSAFRIPAVAVSGRVAVEAVLKLALAKRVLGEEMAARLADTWSISEPIRGSAGSDAATRLVHYYCAMSRLDDLQQFYFLLFALEERLAGFRHLANCSGRMSWPKRGVYFFMEPGETRSHSGRGPRIVRIGTHALKPGSQATLWNRLSQHRGVARTGGGNHRGSIFRLIVGTALLDRDPIDCDSWDDRRGSAPPEVREREQPLERAVSQVIGNMPFLWLSVEDEPGPQSLREFIERNAIALLSNYGRPPIDPPSDSWLGIYCTRKKVRTSGLWNSNHVDESYDPAFLDTLALLVDRVGEPE